jgi:DNA invertase Pin-like site-specific DNA recombinase
MGRLTLNVLLSFAQFEREVRSERVRDRVAASKAKDMWMTAPAANLRSRIGQRLRRGLVRRGVCGARRAGG